MSDARQDARASIREADVKVERPSSSRFKTPTRPVGQSFPSHNLVISGLSPAPQVANGKGFSDSPVVRTGAARHGVPGVKWIS